MLRVVRLSIVGCLTSAIVAVATPVLAAKSGGQSCIKRHMAKGETACIAKAKCDGVTSRKEAARRCNT
jgi:hypothetical protein